MLLHSTPFRPHWSELKGRTAGTIAGVTDGVSPSARRAAAALASLVGASFLLRWLAARWVPTPWIAPDEMLYGLLGRNLWAHGELGVLGRSTPYYSLVYPALAGLPYGVLKAAQALLLSLTAVAVYVWGRSLVAPRWALLAAALTLASPGLVYSGMVMSEAAFVPASVLAAWATARALERPTGRRQLLLVAALALAVATRLQAIVLVPAVLTAVALNAALARERRAVRPFLPFVAGSAVAGIALLLVGSAGLGGYSVVADGGYRPGKAAAYVAYHAGALLLACGVVPACALALVALRARTLPPGARALVAVAVAFCVWTVAEVGVFASRYADRVVERHLLGLVPLLFLALAVWLDRGAPRSYAAAALVAFAAGALVLAIPYGRFVDPAGVQDAPTVAAALELPHADPLLLVGATGVALAAAFALLPGRLAAALALAALVVVSVGASLQVRDVARAQQAVLTGPDPHWVDRAARGPVAFVFGGGWTFTAVWAHAFWNRSIDAVYDLPGATVGGPMPQSRLQLGGDGRLAIAERYAVLPSSATAAGTRLATATLAGTDVGGLGLWRLDGPPRLLELRWGFLPNGDVPYEAEVRDFACAPGGTWTVTLLGKSEQSVDLLANGRSVQTVRLSAGRARTAYVHVRPRVVGDCVLRLRPSTLVGTTTISFARG